MLLTEKYNDLLESAKMPLIAESEKSSVALMLENQAMEETKLLAEGTVASDVQQFVPIFMPLARRVMPALIANELVGVQPLNTPTGFIYSLNFNYLGGGANAADSSSTLRISPNKDSQILNITGTTGIAGVAVGDEIAKNGDATVSGTVVYVEGSLALVKLTGTLVDNADVIAGGSTAKRFTTADELNVTAGDIVIGSTYSNELSFRKVLKNYTGPVATSAAELLGYDMKEVGFSIVRKSIEAVSRKLKGEYSVEMYQDLKAMHGLNADEELMNMMAVEVQNEMDREIVEQVNTWATATPDVSAFTTAALAAGQRNDIDGFSNIAIKIANESREIARRTRRGAGNVIIASPKVVTMLETLKGYQGINSTVNGQVVGTGVVGTFNKMKVVMDVFAPSEYVTVLYKGADRRDAIGYFAPYVPVSFTRITHEASGQPAIILSTRYGITSNPLNPEDYARTFAVDFTGTTLA